jgi:two-component system CheB/CheR fusion protein
MAGPDTEPGQSQQSGAEDAPDREKRTRPCPVVGIGASAGGLEAFQEFFEAMPPDSGMAFVLVQHFSPRYGTLMPELLAQHTAMPVQTAEAETLVEPNHVYVIPPGATLTIDDCVLFVTSTRSRARRSPIDGFLRSLAEDQGDDAVGVILSGTGTDGALGLKAVKEHGGMTMVQEPSTAAFDSMPRSAVLTGAADHVLPVREMPRRLTEHARGLLAARGGGSLEGLREEIAGHLGKICAVLRRRTGHDFRRYKQSTLVRRVRRRMSEAGVESVDAYVGLLARDEGEADQLFRDLLISVTHFFRDPEAFEALALKVIPRLFEGKDADGQVRVWVPGCATGEEAYSIAILLRDYASRQEVPPQIQVFATDIDAHALETARQAWYPESVADQVSPERLSQFFVKQGNMYQVAREIRETCLFSTHNLITDPPFSRLDLISCRNLLIYLESDLQKRIIPLCHYALRPGGFLFLGSSENVSGPPDLFRRVDKRHRIYQSRDTLVRPPVRFPLERGRPLLAPRAPEERHRHASSREQSVARAFESVLLEDYAPPCVVVNEGGDIVRFSPRTGRYLEPAAGTPRLNVVEMARPGLRLDLRTALHKAVTTRVPVCHESVAVEIEGQAQHLNLIVRPLPEAGEDPGLFLIVFQEVLLARDSERDPEPAEPGGGRGTAESPLVRRLEAELRSTKDHLQATLEELESSNEELVSSNEELLSMNEELQSANEELQTSKEELQSVNQELETVNTELKKKVEELDQANGDLQNLFQSTQIATVFVDRELRIKKFTPAATEVFRLIDGDVGRPITDIVPRFAGNDLVGDVREVLLTRIPVERQVLLLDGEFWYMLRVLPYRTVDHVMDGVVITFVDITVLKRTEEERALAEEALREAARRKDEFLAMLGHELRNPLAPVRNCLHILRLSNASPEQVERALGTIDRQVAHLTRLVDDLLDVARISRGRVYLRRERLDLTEAVRATVDDQRGDLEARGLAVELELPDRSLWLHGDATRLSQIVGNVLHNAGKFTGLGGRVAISLREVEGTAEVTIRDTGIGMEPELLAQVFDPFSQADRSPDRSRGGLGLGLALVRALAELHGGTAEIASEGPGRGTAVTLRLPLGAPEPADPSAPEDASGRAGEARVRRCLVIEDNADAAESMALLLELAGHQVAVAHDGGRGIEEARRFRPEIVLCDIGLPHGMDGYDVARALRADPDLSGVCLIALTGYGQDEDRRRSQEAGFDAHLTKPADLDVLRRLLADRERPTGTEPAHQNGEIH